MIQQIIDKLFCKHKWKTHTKEVYKWHETVIADGTEYWHQPVLDKIEFSEVTEVLICDQCGKIKIIDY